MPEIKHQFTGGKMNKDLDERLVPNGEYRDALNIQVSTSEDSDVGTVQNILGNSLIAGQDFIDVNAVCVGSIADEKNDKLYYFTSSQQEIIRDRAFTSSAEWIATTGVSEDYTGVGVLIASDASTAGEFGGFFQEFDLVDGKSYKLTATFSENETAGVSSNLYFIGGNNWSSLTGNNMYRPFGYPSISNGIISHVFTFDQSQNNNQTSMRFKIQLTNGDTAIKRVRLENLSLVEMVQDTIIEYDSNANSITPVLIDLQGSALKFNINNIITGINIIDDLLLWTDNENEPKKINIQRSIEGTIKAAEDLAVDVGTAHTEFLNDKRGLSEPIKEEHITVIKKAPKVAPTIELLSEEGVANTINTGVMNITTAPTPFPEKLTENNYNTLNYNAANQGSSLWIDPVSDRNYLYDFSTLSVGDYFDTTIPTDINGDSGFTLNWSVGDTILFKEFGGIDFDEPPQIPLTSYSIKAKIITPPTYPCINDFPFQGLNWCIPDPYTFSDLPTEYAQNGDFLVPNYNGNKPKHYDWSSNSHFDYFPLDNYVEFIDANWQHAFYGTPEHPFEEGVTYNVSFTLSNTVNNSAKLWFTIVGDSDFLVANGGGITTNGNIPYWVSGGANIIYVNDSSANGTHNFTFTLNQTTMKDNVDYANSGIGSLPDLTGKFLFRFDDDSNSGNGFDSRLENVSITRVPELGVGVNATALNAAIRCEVLAINSPPTVPAGLNELKFAVDKVFYQEKLYELKFPRFAYRYQYQDREHSTISPFSQVAFSPGSFDYHPKKGYNIGMANMVNRIVIKDFKTGMPDGVVAIDIIYKDDSSPNLYIVDTIKPKHTVIGGGSNTWDDGELTVSSEQINQTLPSNQLLRLWDAVPKKALAQDITGNRIIYGNYTHGFDLKYNNEDYYPDFNFSILSDNNISLTPKKSIKSLREYQLGVIFVDEYGRETPVISNKSGTEKLDKFESKNSNSLKISFNNVKYPDNMKYFKFFIKETSGEYYNLAMDRFYNAEDDHVWLSFPSSDRNKVDEDTFLILKKGVESDEVVSEEAKYKILDIQGQAPDFIKQNKQLISEKTHNVLGSSSDTAIFGTNLSELPLEGSNFFKMRYEHFHDSTGSDLHKIKDGDLYIEFSNATNNTSDRYRISKITTDYIDDSTGVTLPVDKVDAEYSVKLDKQLRADVNFITDDILGFNPSKIDNGTVVNIYKNTVEAASKFDGRFFVKINVDSTFSGSISPLATEDTKYKTVASRKLYYLSSNNTNLHSSALTGQTHGVYTDGQDGSNGGSPYGQNGGFGRFAPFFRNYNHVSHAFGQTDGTGTGLETRIGGVTSSGAEVDVGQYRFGHNTTGQREWVRELAWITTDPDSTEGGFERNGDHGNINVYPTLGPRVADRYISDEITSNTPGVTPTVAPKINKEAVYNIDGEQIDGSVWFIDDGPYSWTSPSNTLDWGTVDSNSNSGTGITTDSTGSFSFLDIAIGGIYHEEYIEGATGNIPTFWYIGKDGGNTNYLESTTKNFVSKIYPGQKFRFREDPNQEVYTVQANVGSHRRIRWQMEDEYPDSSYISSNNSSNDASFIENSIQLSPNFTKNWKPRFINESGGGTVAWDPTGTLGPISNGLELAINHSSGQIWGDTSDDQPWVMVDSLNATDQITGKQHAITTGMILVSHSDGPAAATYDGTNGSTYSYKELAVKRIEGMVDAGGFKLHLSGYRELLVENDITTLGILGHKIWDSKPVAAKEMIFKQPRMNGYSQYSVNRINAQHGDVNGGIMAIGYHLDFVEAIESESVLPNNPAIWETEPKESTDLDIYYEASGLNPLQLEDDTKSIIIPYGSIVEHDGGPGINWIEAGTYVNEVYYGTVASGVSASSTDITGWWINIISPSDSAATGAYEGSLWDNGYIVANESLKITKPNGDIIIIEILNPGVVDGDGRTTTFNFNPNMYSNKTKYILNWHNCYSFGNGVESNRIRDNFNLPYMSNGVKVSTTFEEGHGEESRTGGLIYSGLYNSNGSINNLNQFIMAEKITKDINPIYSSIQKLHSRDSDLVVLCEDKCLKILANKDAVFNADGNPQLTANENVLGQTIPFSGEYGISKDPESFASESYRVYFTDKVRGAVMRLSKDGLTPISMYGMSDWFKDNLRLSTKVLGSYDDKKEEYNVTLEISPGYTDNPSSTISFKENVNGWVSFKSFLPEQGVSMASNYYTMLQGRLYRHHDESEDRNTFYNTYSNSSINVVLNDGPGSVKSFHTLCYEGSQSNVAVPLQNNGELLNDGEYYNLTEKFGWFVSGIETDKEVGSLNEFIEKEGKWFNYIKGVDSDITSETDFGAFDIQGIGTLKQTITADNAQSYIDLNPSYGAGAYAPEVYGWDWVNNIMEFDGLINASLQIGDIIYYQQASNTTTLGGFNVINPNEIVKFGEVTEITSNTITVDETVFGGGNIPDPTHGAFILFAKNHIINTSSLVGYFADVKFENNSTDKIELFSVGSEITESSK